MSEHPERNKRKKRVAWVVAGLVGLALYGTAARLSSVVERAADGRVFSPSTAPTRSVAIVLGARVSADGAPSAALEDRLQCALDLYQRGAVRDVLVSGDHGRAEYDEVNAMRAWLVARGVPSERVFLDHAGFRTLDTMARAHAVFAVERAAVCTQRFHLPRSLWLARAFSIDAIGVVADRRVYPARRFDATREWLARVRAALDTEVLGTRPKFLGTRVPIGTDSRQTHDRHTVPSPPQGTGGSSERATPLSHRGTAAS